MIIPKGVTVHVGKKKYKSGQEIDSNSLPADMRKKLESKSKPENAPKPAVKREPVKE
jgi:hypothetical protein